MRERRIKTNHKGVNNMGRTGMVLFIGAFILLVLAVYVSLQDREEKPNANTEVISEIKKLEANFNAALKHNTDSYFTHAKAVADDIDGIKGRIEKVEKQNELLEKLATRPLKVAPVEVTVMYARPPKPKTPNLSQEGERIKTLIERSGVSSSDESTVSPPRLLKDAKKSPPRKGP